MKLLCLVAVAASVLLSAVPAGAAPRQVPRGFHGVTWDREIAEASDGVRDAHGGLMARSGVESVRTVFSWAQAQPAGPGATDFSHTDRLVAAAAKRRIELLPIVMYAPGWAKTSSDLVAPPARPSDYAAYIGQLVDRYGRGGTFWRERSDLPKRPVRSWQIWNEPNMEWQWAAPDWPNGYVGLLREAHAAIKSRDPRARVVLAGLVIEVWEELRHVYAAGGGPYFDVAAAHTYTDTPAWSLEVLRRTRRVMDAAGDRRKPIWATEVSWPAGKGRQEEGPDFVNIGDRGMARYLARFFAEAARRAKALRLQRVFWYTWASGYELGDELWEYSGLVRFADGQTERRPALRAFTRSARRLQGCRKTARGTCRRASRRQ
jgi:hypothetical protein